MMNNGYKRFGRFYQRHFEEKRKKTELNPEWVESRNRELRMRIANLKSKLSRIQRELKVRRDMNLGIEERRLKEEIERFERVMRG